MRAQPLAPEVFPVLPDQQGSRRCPSAVKRDGHAVASERWHRRELIADLPRRQSFLRVFCGSGHGTMTTTIPMIDGYLDGRSSLCSSACVAAMRPEPLSAYFSCCMASRRIFVVTIIPNHLCGFNELLAAFGL
jgi:hypothetical protein